MMDIAGARDCVVSRVPDQNGVSLLYIMLEIHHSGRETSICRTITVGGAGE